MKKKVIIGSLMALAFGFIIYNFGNSFAVLDNDARVKPNTDLTYYIDVIYDGVDGEVVTSSDSTIAKVYSDYIYVEDKLPEGLTFKEFITSEDGTIGAVKRSDGTSCTGYVVGDAAGLNYDSATGIVSFKVKNLQAGCKLTVGIVTTTPSLNGETRKDFYNTASGRENNLSTFSNTVHVWMGKEDAVTYTVSYSYTGTVPDGAPVLPGSESYIEGATVGVNNDTKLAGYTFSGWTSTDVTVSNDTFTMPSSNVAFTGSFTKNSEYTVSYTVSGVGPTDYIVPTNKSYNVGEDVIVDTLEVGTEIDGYRFLGWTSSDVTITDGIFVMPNKNVSLVGTFERIVYTVSYQYQGNVIPNDADSLLPSNMTYAPGDTVTVASNNLVSDGYEFLGWISDSTFVMPNNDVVIYGEWMRVANKFTLGIVQEFVDQKDYYREGNLVKFKTTITNDNDFSVGDILLENSLEDVYFVTGEGYTVKSSKYVSIDNIAANDSVIVYAEYLVGDDVIANYSNTVTLTGAIADDDNVLDVSRNYKSSISFNVANLSLVIRKVNENNDELSGSVYKMYSDSATDTEIGSGLEFTIDPDKTYYIKESRAITGYQLSSNVIEITVDDNGNLSADGEAVIGENGVYTLTLLTQEINMLPNTGGIGTYIFTFIGLGVMIIAGIGYYLYEKNKKKKKKKRKKIGKEMKNNEKSI